MVTLEGVEVVLVGSQADVAVGAEGEECVPFDSEEAGGGGFEVADLVGQVVTGSEGDGGFKQGRGGGEFLRRRGGLRVSRRLRLGRPVAGGYGQLGELAGEGGMVARPVAALPRDRAGVVRGRDCCWCHRR